MYLVRQICRFRTRYIILSAYKSNSLLSLLIHIYSCRCMPLYVCLLILTNEIAFLYLLLMKNFCNIILFYWSIDFIVAMWFIIHQQPKSMMMTALFVPYFNWFFKDSSVYQHFHIHQETYQYWCIIILTLLEMCLKLCPFYSCSIVQF